MYEGKGTGFLFHGLLRLPGDKSTWAVMLFRKRGALERLSPLLPASPVPSHTHLSPHLPAPQPHKTFPAGTSNLWVQFSARPPRLSPSAHSTSWATSRPWVCPQMTLGGGRRSIGHFPLTSQPLGGLTTGSVALTPTPSPHPQEETTPLLRESI